MCQVSRRPLSCRRSAAGTTEGRAGEGSGGGRGTGNARADATPARSSAPLTPVLPFSSFSLPRGRRVQRRGASCLCAACLLGFGCGVCDGLVDRAFARPPPSTPPPGPREAAPRRRHMPRLLPRITRVRSPRTRAHLPLRLGGEGFGPLPANPNAVPGPPAVPPHSPSASGAIATPCRASPLPHVRPHGAAAVGWHPPRRVAGGGGGDPFGCVARGGGARMSSRDRGRRRRRPLPSMAGCAAPVSTPQRGGRVRRDRAGPSVREARHTHGW